MNTPNNAANLARQRVQNILGKDLMGFYARRYLPNQSEIPESSESDNQRKDSIPSDAEVSHAG